MVNNAAMLFCCVALEKMCRQRRVTQTSHQHGRQKYLVSHASILICSDFGLHINLPEPKDTSSLKVSIIVNLQLTLNLLQNG